MCIGCMGRDRPAVVPQNPFIISFMAVRDISFVFWGVWLCGPLDSESSSHARQCIEMGCVLDAWEGIDQL